eukprot:CAMPEP_0174720910 /NCGR_PEP_ID=MMETSP1094-20130205/34830_1 /TAXON_ID=156173 /ORGANISM="Chrysochromulina brevifilum, Strain UTEX LB 985" /LENGTH=92 /DNA_ID=CAMNT_0015921495 /DNA_START=36 /DNA_END=314 /DNA_ORIENTATION=-
MADFASAFKLLDVNGTGKLSLSEMSKILTQRGNNPLTTEEVSALLGDFEVDADGNLDISAFVMAFSGVHAESPFVKLRINIDAFGVAQIAVS